MVSWRHFGWFLALSFGKAKLTNIPSLCILDFGTTSPIIAVASLFSDPEPNYKVRTFLVEFPILLPNSLLCLSLTSWRYSRLLTKPLLSLLRLYELIHLKLQQLPKCWWCPYIDLQLRLSPCTPDPFIQLGDISAFAKPVHPLVSPVLIQGTMYSNKKPGCTCSPFFLQLLHQVSYQLLNISQFIAVVIHSNNSTVNTVLPPGSLLLHSILHMKVMIFQSCLSSKPLAFSALLG